MSTSNEMAVPLTVGYLEEYLLRSGDMGALSTRQGYAAVVKQMKDLAGAGYKDATVDDDFCETFADYLLSKVKPSSVRSYLQRLTTFLHRVAASDSQLSVPQIQLRNLMPERVNAAKCFLTKEELQRLLAADCPSESTKMAFTFSCYTGLLRGEVRELRWDSIRHNGTGMVLVRPIEHSKEQEKVPLIEQANLILKELEREYMQLPLEEQDERVFHLRSNSSISQDLRTWGRKAGIEKPINYMTSRHTFATMALRAGIDLYVVSRWCGHSDVHTAQAYLELIDRTPHSNTELLSSAFA